MWAKGIAKGSAMLWQVISCRNKLKWSCSCQNEADYTNKLSQYWNGYKQQRFIFLHSMSILFRLEAMILAAFNWGWKLREASTHGPQLSSKQGKETDPYKPLLTVYWLRQESNTTKLKGRGQIQFSCAFGRKIVGNAGENNISIMGSEYCGV